MTPPPRPRPKQLGKPPGGYEADDLKRRLRWVEEHTGRDLAGLPLAEPSELRGILENQVGHVPIPMGVASPLIIQGTHARGEFVVPLCTVEGTLALSMTRGMLAIAMAGGCRTVHLRQELSRSPAFRMGSVADIPDFLGWIAQNLGPIRAAAESTSRHARLLRIDPLPIQEWVILDFVYDTGNAAGQNMVTLATHAACDHIRAELGRPYLIESGFNSDKKPSHRSLMSGRGHAVAVEFDLPDRVLATLGVTAPAVLEAQSLGMAAAQAAGLLGNNLHLANGLTAIYLATGQDAACVAENALALTTLSPADDGLAMRVTMPSLTVGTVGGGTRLPAQRRNLELLGCDDGPHAARKLAEIIAAACAALELSLMAAIVSGTFADAHRRYGRRA